MKLSTPAKVIMSLALATGAFLLGREIYKTMRKPKTDLPDTGTKTGSGMATQKTVKIVDRASLPDTAYPLKMGSKGKLVWDFQYAMNNKYNSGLDQDGIFGILTETEAKNRLGKTSIDAATLNSIE